MPINPTQIMKIALEATVSESTVRNVYKGGGNRNNRERVRQAAKKLGFPEPVVK
jgi:DNA-binding LacI/PurR family transcriptional regulator